MFVQLYTPLYVSIISKYYKEFNYIDLFAGSGVGKLEDTAVPDSPILGETFGYYLINGYPIGEAWKKATEDVFSSNIEAAIYRAI